MTASRSLRGRLVSTYAAVIAVVLVVVFFAVRVMTPAFVEQRVQNRLGSQGGQGAGPGGPPPQATSSVSTEVAQLYEDSLNLSLLIAAAVGIVIAIALAWWFTRRILGRLEEVQEATRQLAAGDYEHRLPPQDDAELADLADSVNTLGASLAATEQARARLVSDLAHEIRNPLATIESYMEGLIDGVLPANAETYHTVSAEAHRLQRLTSDLSLLSREQEGVLEMHPVAADLVVVAQRVADRLRVQYEAKGVQLTTDLGGELPVFGDPDRLDQALTNVVGNALSYTEAGGTVSVRGRLHGRDCVVDVTDTGRGIPAAELERIFSRFTRLQAGGPGTGIGLHIARRIAEMHEGTLTATSDGLGEGATFTLSIPRPPD